MKYLILISVILATVLACRELNQECRLSESGLEVECCGGTTCVISPDGHTGKCEKSVPAVDPVNHCVTHGNFCVGNHNCCPPSHCIGRIPKCLGDVF